MTMASSSADGQGGARRDPAETRHEILEAARRFLWERPFRDLTVGQLMDGTSVGRSTFYLHFDDLYGLAGALLEEVDEDLERSTREGRESAEFPLSLGLALDGAVDVWVRHGPVLRAIGEASALDARLEDLYRRRFGQRMIVRVRRAIERAQAQGRLDAELDAGETATLLTLMNERYLGDRLGRHPQVDPEVPRRTVVMAWTRILRGDDGRSSHG